MHNVCILTDKELFQALSTADVSLFETPLVRERGLAVPLPAGTPGLRAEETYIPYRTATPDVAPEYAPIGGPHIVRFTGSTHDEHGFLTKDPAKVGRATKSTAPIAAFMPDQQESGMGAIMNVAYGPL